MVSCRKLIPIDVNQILDSLRLGSWISLTQRPLFLYWNKTRTLNDGQSTAVSPEAETGGLA